MLKKRCVDVHEELRRPRKVGSETVLEYACKMRKVANQGDIDELSQIAYIVKGLTDACFNKNFGGGG